MKDFSFPSLECLRRIVVPFLFTLLLICGLQNSKAQEWRIEFAKRYQLQFENNWVEKMMMIGDKVPDMWLQWKIMDSVGSNKLSELKGKIIILDFWSTSCTSCILAFPKMEKLQKEFGNKIQIFLVNVWENHQQIKERLHIRNRSSKLKFSLPNLPLIANAIHLWPLFPFHSVPHHVWIDQFGIVRIIGPEQNTYRDKILDLLQGKSIFNLNDENTRPAFDGSFSLHDLLGKQIKKGQYNSLFTVHNNNYAPLVGGNIQNVVENRYNTIRSTYVNIRLTDFCQDLYQDSMRDVWDKTIFKTPNFGINNVLLMVKDTSKYTDEFLPGLDVTDQSFIKSRFCYEQIIPIQAKRFSKQLMVLEFNCLLEQLFSTKVKIKEYPVECFVLVRASEDSLFCSKNSDFGIDTITVDKVEMLKYSGISSLKSCIKSALDNSDFIQNLNGKHFYMIDDANYNGKVDLILPLKSQMKSIETLRLALLKYNLDIKKETRLVKFIVFEELNNNGCNLISKN